MLFLLLCRRKARPIDSQKMDFGLFPLTRSTMRRKWRPGRLRRRKTSRQTSGWPTLRRDAAGGGGSRCRVYRHASSRSSLGRWLAIRWDCWGTSPRRFHFARKEDTTSGRFHSPCRRDKSPGSRRGASDKRSLRTDEQEGEHVE